MKSRDTFVNEVDAIRRITRHDNWDDNGAAPIPAESWVAAIELADRVHNELPEAGYPHTSAGDTVYLRYTWLRPFVDLELESGQWWSCLLKPNGDADVLENADLTQIVDHVRQCLPTGIPSSRRW